MRAGGSPSTIILERFSFKKIWDKSSPVASSIVTLEGIYCIQCLRDRIVAEVSNSRF